MSKLSTNISAKHKHLCKLGYQLYDQGKFEHALRPFYQAWLILPKPQGDYVQAGWTLTAIGDTYYRLGKLDQAIEALASAQHCPQTHGNPFIHLRLGQCYADKNQITVARVELFKAYQKGGLALFQNEDYYLDLIGDLMTNE